MSTWIIVDTEAKIVAAERAVYDLARTLLPERFTPEAQTYVGGGGHPPKTATVPTALVPWRRHPTLAQWAICIDRDKPGADVALLLRYATGLLAADRYPDGVARSYESLMVVGTTMVVDGATVRAYVQPIKLIDGSIGSESRVNHFRGARTQVQTQSRWDAMIAAVAPANRVSPLPSDWNPSGL